MNFRKKTIVPTIAKRIRIAPKTSELIVNAVGLGVGVRVGEGVIVGVDVGVIDGEGVGKGVGA